MPEDAETAAALEPAASDGSTTRASCPPTIPQSLRAGAAVALIGSWVVGLGELAAGNFMLGFGGVADWPALLLLAAVGRTVLTHVFFWLPIMLVIALLYGLTAQRRRKARPAAALTAAFTLFALLVVGFADLEMAHRLKLEMVLPALLATPVVVLVAYLVIAALCKMVGTRGFSRCSRVVVAMCLVATVAVGVALFRTPLSGVTTDLESGKSKAFAATKQPSVIWIVMDTGRADHLGCYGYDKATTPNLDAFAAKSIVFENVAADSTWTVPSHASMLTGLPARSHGAGSVTMQLDDAFTTAAEALRENGYATALFTNNTLMSSMSNLAQGFSTECVVDEFAKRKRFSLSYLSQRLGFSPVLPWLDDDEGAATTNWLIGRWLNGVGGRPVFLFVNYMELHAPYEVPRAYRERFMTPEQVAHSYDLRRRLHGDMVQWINIRANIEGDEFLTETDRTVIRNQYDAAVHYLDDRLGQLLNALDRRGVLDNAWVIVTADHGEYLGQHGMWSHNFLAYQEVVHVPLIIHPPRQSRGVRVTSPVQLSEIFPTVFAQVFDGKRWPARPSRNLLRLAVEGEEDATAVAECFGPFVRQSEKLLNNSDPAFRHRAARQLVIMDGRFKYIESSDGTRELFDLQADPADRSDVSSAHRQDARRLSRLLEAWKSQTPKYEPPADDKGEVDPEMLKSLKAIGYVGDDE